MFLINYAWLRSNFKNLCLMFHQISKHSKNNKIDSFVLFGNPSETLALVFEILHTFTEIKLSTDADINFSVHYISIWLPAEGLNPVRNCIKNTCRSWVSCANLFSWGICKAIESASNNDGKWSMRWCTKYDKWKPLHKINFAILGLRATCCNPELL